jgi:protein-S-isoprenylcysteine O-methyltransferase Ste14
MAMAKKPTNLIEPSSVADAHKTSKTLSGGSAWPSDATWGSDSAWPTDSAWITGAATLAVLLISFLFLQQLYSESTAVFSIQKMAAHTQTGLIILLVAFATMVLVENWRTHKSRSLLLFHRAPLFDANFFAVTLLRYLEHLVLLWLIQLFYRTADEYGFVSKHPFYQPWHQLLDVFFTAYIWLGLPYLLLVRSFKWHADVEQRDCGLLLELGFWSLVKRLPRTSHWVKPDKIAAIPGKTIFLDLLIKMFFLPLMFVFFCDQLSHLMNNLDYLAAGMPKAFVGGEWQHTQWNFDLANLIVSLLFTLHTGLAFCAIAINQRWLPHLTQANPRLIGWLACLLSFPPFIHMIITSHIPGVTGPHLDGPSSVLAQLPNPWIVTFAVLFMGLFYTAYLIATINLGAHFSELTNRGIVRTGLYSWVRHPAYVAKLLGWLCILIPLVGLNMFDGNWTVVGTLSAAYVISVAIYYWRAITEEQHLSEDPNYRAYCDRVRWRFIPGIW